MVLIPFACSLSFLLTVVLTSYYKKFAVRWNILDVPNVRSSHKEPIPRGAGITFFISFNVVLGLLAWQNQLSMYYLYPVLLGGPVILILGYWDDLRSLPATIRLVFHFSAALFVFLLISSGFSKAVEISFLPNWPWLTAIFCILFIAWFINLYNFMDGADGLATSIGMVGSGLIAILSYYAGNKDLAIIYVVLSYALAGFLVFNWYPAKVFMGDSGAYYLGYIFGSLALVSKMYYDSSLYVHLIIFGLFIVDATWTLLRRLFRRERVFQGHRMHAFQKLMARGLGHAKVTSIYILITVLWLFPMAWLSMHYATLSFLFLVLAYLPIFGFVLYFKAGEV